MIPALSPERVRRLLRLRPRDVAEVVAVCGAAVRAEWGLRRRTLPATAGALGVTFRAVPSADDQIVAPDRLALPPWAWRRARIARAVMRFWPLGDTCLRRALVTGNRLSDLGPELVIGIRAGAAPRVDAHAWLRIAGVDLDPLATEYLAFGES